jgi:hypothetical protein
MRPLFIFNVLISVIALVSCNKEKKSTALDTGNIQKYYYPDGKLYMEIEVINDSIPHGLSKEYFKNGQLFQEIQYSKGLKHGLYKRYYEDGKVSLEVQYDNGRRHGIEKKYRKDGKLAYEAPYYQDHPTIGLKEYYTDGTLVNKFPSIEITEEDRLFQDMRFSLVISLTENYDVEFYEGSLTDGYIGKDCELVYETSPSKGKIDYSLGPGEFLMKKLNIIAKIKTDLGNYYITQKTYNLAVQNR